MHPAFLLVKETALRIFRASGMKYVLVALAAGIWMLAFDRYSLFARQRVDREIQSLRRDKAHYEQAMKGVDYQSELILRDPEELERLAREKHYLRRSGEDVYVVQEAPAALAQQPAQP